MYVCIYIVFSTNHGTLICRRHLHLPRPPMSFLSYCTASFDSLAFAGSCPQQISSFGGGEKYLDKAHLLGPFGRQLCPPGDATRSLTTGAIQPHVPFHHCSALQVVRRRKRSINQLHINITVYVAVV